MALHDYRTLIELPKGQYIALEVQHDRIGITVDDGVDPVEIRIDTATAGLLYDQLAGAIKTLEGLK